MRHFIIVASLLLISIITFGQSHNIGGTYSNIISGVEVTFNPDSTFLYTTNQDNPVFYRWEDFSEKGKWAISGDTIILNPNLQKKIFVESDFKEEKVAGNTNLLLTFNHIKRYFDAEGNITRTDTLQIDRLDYVFNEFKKKKQTRVSPYPTTRCTFAGYIPKEIITNSHTVSVDKPTERTTSIFIGCYELQGTKQFMIKDPGSNHYTLNVYSNYYEDGQIRQMKFLVKNDNILYTKQKANNAFEKDNFWDTGAKLKKQKAGSL